MNTIKLSKVCSCGKGYRSRIDGKCGHCRSKKEAALFDKYHNELAYNYPHLTPNSLLGLGYRVKYFGAIYEIN